MQNNLKVKQEVQETLAGLHIRAKCTSNLYCSWVYLVNPVSKRQNLSLLWTSRQKEPNVTALARALVARRAVSAGGGPDKGRRRLRDRPLCTETLCTLTKYDSIYSSSSETKEGDQTGTQWHQCAAYRGDISLWTRTGPTPAAVPICTRAYVLSGIITAVLDPFCEKKSEII